MNPYTKQLASVWFQHDVVVAKPDGRNALGATTRGARFTVKAAVDAQARTVTDTNGKETVASATVRWSPEGPMPSPGWLVTLPAQFGLKPDRQVIVARHATTGTGLTPDFVEVVLQ